MPVHQPAVPAPLLLSNEQLEAVGQGVTLPHEPALSCVGGVELICLRTIIGIRKLSVGLYRARFLPRFEKLCYA